MNKSIKLMMLVTLCAAGSVVTNGFASEAAKGLETPLLSVVGGDEAKSDSVVVDIAALAQAAGLSEASSSASSSTKSSPAKSEDGLLAKEQKGLFDRFFDRVLNWSDQKKRAWGYVGVTTLEGINEVYYKFANTTYGIPAALFIGQLAGIVAADEKCRKKLIGAFTIGSTVSILETILRHTAETNIDLLIPASALGFIFYSTVSDLMKRRKNLPNSNPAKDVSTSTPEETLADG